LPVSDELPEEAHKLMRHYRQRTRRPSVEFIPVPHKEPDKRDPWNRAMDWLQNNRHFCNQ
jgi:Serine dehydrogenase proteinase